MGFGSELKKLREDRLLRSGEAAKAAGIAAATWSHAERGTRPVRSVTAGRMLAALSRTKPIPDAEMRRLQALAHADLDAYHRAQAQRHGAHADADIDTAMLAALRRRVGVQTVRDMLLVMCRTAGVPVPEIAEQTSDQPTDQAASHNVDQAARLANMLRVPGNVTVEDDRTIEESVYYTPDDDGKAKPVAKVQVHAKRTRSTG